MSSKKVINKGEKDLYMRSCKSWDKNIDIRGNENLRMGDRNSIDWGRDNITLSVLCSY